MAEAASSPKGGKLDNLPKEDLIKYIRKQAAQIKDVRKKNEDLTALLNHEKQEVERLEQEKKSWLSRGVSAEFEKKEKLAKKDRELRIAAQLGQKMLVENDELRIKFDEQELEHEKAVKETEDRLNQVMEEKLMLEETVKAVQAEYKLAKEEAESFSKSLERALAEQERESENNKQKIAHLTAELKDVRYALDLEKEGKGETDLLVKEVKNLRAENDDLLTMNLELKAKVNSFPNTDAQEMLRMQEELKDMETALKSNQKETDATRKSFGALKAELEEAKRNCAELHQHIELIHADKEECNNYVKQLDEELTKLKSDKEKAMKSIKTLKTKAERGSQVEEELKRQLTTICAERDDIQSKHTTLQREKKTLILNNKKLKEKLRNIQKDQKEDEDSERGRDSPRGSENDVSIEFMNLKEYNQKLEQEKKELYEQYEAVKAEIANIEGERSEMEHMIRSYETEILKLNDKFEMLRREHDAIKFENDENVSSKVALEEEKEHLLAGKQALERDIEKIIEEKDGILARYSALEEEHSNCKALIEERKGEKIVETSEGVTGEEVVLVKTEVLRLEQALEIVKEQNTKSETTISELRETVKEKEEDLKRLADEKQNLEKQCCVLTQRLDEKAKVVQEDLMEVSGSDETGDNKSEPVNSEEEKESLLQELARAQEHCRELELKLDCLQEKGQIAESETEQLKLDKETLEFKCKEILNRMESLEFERAEISTNAQEDFSRLSEQKEELLCTLEKEREVQSQLEQRCQDLTRQNELLSGKQQEHKANVTRLQGRVDELLGKLQALNEEKMHQESEIEELFKAQDELHNKLDLEIREKKDKEFIIKDLEEKLTAMEEDMNRTSQEKQDTFSRLQDLLKTQENYQGELHSKINEMRMENETLRQENQALKETIVTYKEEFKVHKTQANESSETLEEMAEGKQGESERENVCISREPSDEAPATLKGETENNSEMDKVEREDELARLQKEINVLMSERDQLQGILDETERRCGVLQGRLTEMESSLDESNEMDERLHNLMQLNHEQAMQLKQNDCVIQELQEANTELDSMLRTATQELKLAEERVKELTEVKEKLSALDSELNSLEEERNLLKRSLDSTVADRGEKEGEVERLRDALTRAEEALHERHFEATQTNLDLRGTRDEEYGALSQKVSGLENQVQLLQQQNEDLVTDKQLVEKKLSLACDQEIVQKIEAEKQTLKERVSSLEEEVERKEASVIQLEQDVASLMRELDSCREEIQRFREQHDLMQAELTTKGKDLLKAQKGFTKLKQALQNQKEMSQSLKESERKANEVFSEEKQSLLNTISEKEVLIQELRAIEENLVQELEERKNVEVEKSEVLQQVADQEMTLKQGLSEKEAEIVEYQKTVERLKEENEAEISRLEASLYEKNLQCQTLTSEKENLVNQCKQLSRDLEEATRFVSAAQDAKQVVEENLKGKMTLLSELSTEKNKLIQDVACKDKELAVMKDQLSSKVDHENTQEVLLKAARYAKDKDDYIDELQGEIRQLKTQCDHWRGKMEASRNERNVVEEKMQKCENEANWNAGRISEVQGALEEACRKLEAKDKEAREAQGRVRELEDELQEAFNKLEELESLMKEKEEKVNKFKAVALRAKKELDLLRGQSDPEKERLQSANEQLQKIAQQFEAELLRQREDCQRHEEDYEAVQKEASLAKTSLEEESQKLREKQEEIQSLSDQVERLTTSLAASENETTILQERLSEETQKADSMKDSLSEMTKRFEECNSRWQEEQESSKALKERLKNMEVQINDAQKEFQHMNVINLEIQDYQKTIESLQKRVSEREERAKDCEQQISVLDGTIVTLKEQLSSTEQQLQESEERGNRLKSVLVKTKKELNDAKQTETEMQKNEKSLRQDIEATRQLLEDYKLQTTDLLSEKESLLAQLKSNAEMSQRSHQALEMKLSRVQNDMVATQQTYSQLKQEFENYKIRAATVLKQQKIKTPEEDKSLDKREREMYEQAIEQLKNRVKESSDHVQVLMHDHEELEVEHERLLQRHSEVLKEVQTVDQKWKSRFENAQKDSNERIMDYEEKLKELTAQKESITGLYKKQRENFEKGEQERENELSLLKQELDELRRQSRRKSDAAEKKDGAEPKGRAKESKLKSPERLKLTIDTGLSRPTERQEGEGMDSSLLEAMEPNTRLTPTSPASSFESANLLERLLSPTDKSPESEWIYSPVQSVEEGIKLKSSHATLEKRVEHLTELLHESEANSVLLTDQAKILKDEIRRLEKNQEREEAMHNLEYLKNVTIKFLKCGASEREYLVPVLSTMLKLNSEEVDFIKEFAKSEQESSDANASSWSSYVYRWSAF